MDRQAAWAEINATLLAKGFEEKQGSSPEYHGQLNIHGAPVDVSLSIPDLTFMELPVIRLLDRSQLAPGVLGHVFHNLDVDSGICYASGVGLPLDLHSPGGSILRVMEQAKKALEVNYAGRGVAEVTAEYQDYWRDSREPFRILATREERGIHFTSLGYNHFIPEVGRPFFALCGDADLYAHKSEKYRTALLVQTDQDIGPVDGCKVPADLTQLETWFKGQAAFSNDHWSKVETALFAQGFVAISAPNCILGVRLQFPSDIKIGLRQGTIRKDKVPRILSSRRSKIGLIRYGGYWTDLQSIAQRNLTGMKTLSGISIAMVGCGTIGSHLAKFLVQSGVGSNAPLMLIDRQLLASGNIGRHYLGSSRIGEAKASALKDELKRFHPQADVHSRIDDATDVWEEIKAADLIIDATGEWNTQYALNERFMADGINATAILHSWVSGNGAAARSFLNLRNDEFCFRCLRPTMKDQHRFPALKPNVEANIAEATCGEGAFYPYSVAAPAIAAALACDVVIAWANGKPGPRLRTQVLDHDRAIHRKPTTPSPHKDCPSCKARRADD